MARVPLNDLSRTDAATASNIVRAVADVIDRGAFLKNRYTAELEQRLSNRLAGRPVLGVGNGTDALYLALRATGVGVGRRVANVANAGGYTTGATLRAGGSPVFVDVDPRTAQMSRAALATVLEATPDVVAVVLTHLYGLVGDVQVIRSLCDERNVTLIEDCAQSMGASVDGRSVGTFGDIATLSFYPTKNLGAFGDAGAVVCATPDLHERVSVLAQYGWGQRYEVTVPGGINSRIDEIQAAVLLEAERLLDAQNERRRAIVSRYAAAVQGERYLLAEQTERYVGHLAVMVTEQRSEDAKRLDASGVGTGIHYPISDHRQPGWETAVPRAELPNTDWLVDRILTLPCFPAMSDDEVDQVADALASL
ncbi:MAG: DegT/DnrJ/EryC1/StrS family aminotransferase [Actinobacteria bacterium]|nr:DegT/DnrJ/EryC1/StrS family aminotransferase [Actinomycetota bacterium]